MRRPSHPAAPLLLALLLAAAPASAAETAPPGEGSESFVFAPCNRTYERGGAELAPVARGPLTLSLSSPRNRVTLEEHELRLTPLPDGTHRAVFTARFAGGGELVMDVDAGGAVSRFVDTVTVPRQERTVEGRVRLARRPGEDGAPPFYELTTVELPAAVEIDVESELAGRFASLCASLSLVVALDCGGVRAALSRARVDLPEPGETYYLPPACLQPDTRRRLDAYLDRNGGS